MKIFLRENQTNDSLVKHNSSSDGEAPVAHDWDLKLQQNKQNY